MEKPETPLPWEMDGDFVFWSRQAGAAYIGEFGEQTDAVYALHACNSYPTLTAINAELVGALEKSVEGWRNVVEFDIIAERHKGTAKHLADELSALIARAKAQGEG